MGDWFMEWNVYWSNPDTHTVVIRNVFKLSGTFNKGLAAFKEHPKIAFSQFLDDLLQLVKYCFWCKCEYEVVIHPWACSYPAEQKIDIYNQLVLNWKQFAHYTYAHLWEDDGEE